MVRKAERMVQWELCSLEHWEQGQGARGRGKGVSKGARCSPTGWAHRVRVEQGGGWLEGIVWQEHSCEPLRGHGPAGV